MAISCMLVQQLLSKDTIPKKEHFVDNLEIPFDVIRVSPHLRLTGFFSFWISFFVDRSGHGLCSIKQVFLHGNSLREAV